MPIELDDETLASTCPSDPTESSKVVPALTILCHPDWNRVGETLILRALSVGQEVLLSRVEPVFSRPDPDEDRGLVSNGSLGGRALGVRHLSRQPMRLRPGTDAGIFIDVSTTRTRVEVDGEKIDQERSCSSQQIARGVVLTLARKIVLFLHHKPFPAPSGSGFSSFGLVGSSPGMERVRQEIHKLAPLEVPVLLRGPTGTGKELVARALHDGCPRRHRPFVAVNMAVLGPTLAAAALFGAERGAYTGADRKRAGHFQSAQGGTLFLDEVGEAPPEVQAMLLRVLETQEIQPVGSSQSVRIDVRIVAATDSRLEEAMAEDRFKTPLYHRLAGYTIYLPALRERREDLGRLLYFFLREEMAKVGEKLPEDGDDRRPWPPAALVANLARHSWPGNVRELRNVARRLAISGPDESTPELEFLLLRPPAGKKSAQTEESAPGNTGPRLAEAPRTTKRRSLRRLGEVTEEELLSALREHRWHIRETANALQVSKPNLYRLMESSNAVRTAQELELDEIEGAVARANGDLEAAAFELEVSLHGLKRRMKSLGLSLG